MPIKERPEPSYLYDDLADSERRNERCFYAFLGTIIAILFAILLAAIVNPNSNYARCNPYAALPLSEVPAGCYSYFED